MRNPSWVDDYFLAVIVGPDDVELPTRGKLRLRGSVSAEDNEAEDATDLTFGEGSTLRHDEIDWAPTGSPDGRTKSIQKTFDTTDATESTAATFTLADETAADYTATVLSRAADGQHFAADLRCAYESTDGTVTELRAPSSANELDGNPAGWSAAFDRSGTSVRVRVKGEAALDVRWSIVANAQIVTREATPPEPPPPPEGFDAMAVGTCLLWIDSTDVTEAEGSVTAVNDKASGSMVASITGGKEPDYNASNADYADAPTIDCGEAQGLFLNSTGLTTSAFTVLVVGDGQDSPWFQDGNGNYLISAGGGSGDKPQITADASTYLASTTAASGVPGVYVFVFNGAASKIFTSALTPSATGSSGSPGDLTSVQIAVGGAYNLSGAGMLGSIRHFAIYDGALSDGDVATLLAAAGEESGITIGA